MSINPSASLDEASVKAHVRAMLADYKAPRHYILTPRIPRADNGKADYKTAKVICLQELEVSAS